MRDKKFGKSGDSIVIEEISDGSRGLGALVHGRHDGSSDGIVHGSWARSTTTGDWNTGGMGTVALNPYYTE